LAKIANSRERLKDFRKELQFLTATAEHLPPRELADAYAMRSKLDQLDNHPDLALGHIERALRLEPENPDYNLAYFTLRARAGDQLPEVKHEARLYFFMAESERLLREGKIDEAQLQLMEAIREAPKNPQPRVRLGNLFYLNKGDVLNARVNFKKAAELAPADVRVWGRYIELLIQSYEWEEANRALARFRSMPVAQSAIDKVMADWHARQGQHAEAQQLYQKALTRDYIEPSVYLAFGKSLLETRNYAQAPFIFALAQRYEPDSPDAIIGTAKAIQGEEGIDRAIAYLRDELQKGGPTRVELLCALAEFLMQKGSWDEAMSFIEQAKVARKDLAQPFKAEAQYYALKPTGGKPSAERKAKEKMLESYQSYLDRNPSDAGILYEKYKVLVDLSEYGAADAVLQKIFELYPKYPNLHFSKGRIYIRLGELKAAQREYELEMANGNSSLPVLLSLGSVLVDLKEYDAALKHFVTGMQKYPKEAEPKVQAGYANYLLKRYEAAVALYREALKLDEGNPNIYRRLGDAYRALGDAANTRWAYQRYLEMEPDAADKSDLQRYL
jgi:tetratricopeptide (TPR) repeat protein